MIYLCCIIQAFRLERSVKRLQSRNFSNSSEQAEMERKESDLECKRRNVLAQRRDAAILDLIGGFIESALQLSLQLYLCIQYSLDLKFWRGIFQSIQFLKPFKSDSICI